ncbi:MAG: hypothetical protein IKM31_07795 [Oscillospiraceae bacterium]|nr:hypothetical protein [Oscillospiraceae bacterium]
MTFFDELKKFPAMTETEIAAMAEELFLEIRHVCLALQKKGGHQLSRVYGWHYFIPPAWQRAEPKYIPVSAANAEDYTDGSILTSCTAENRDAILSRLNTLLLADGFPEGSARPVTARHRNGICHLIQIDIRW